LDNIGACHGDSTKRRQLLQLQLAISRDGSKVLAFGSMTTSDDKERLAKIDEFLKQT
jgi:hypothetical protein